MEFFEPPPPPEKPERSWRPAWMGSPDNELGVAVPIRVQLVRTDTLAILIDQVVAYSTGFSFRLTCRSHPDRDVPDHRFHDIVGPRSDDMTRFLLGVEFGDGRKATNIAFPHHTGDDDPGPVLMGGGGGGGGGRFDFTFWVWPLPPAGSFAFVCRWDAEGVEQTRVEVDAGPILAASTQSEQLWPDAGESSGGWTSRCQTSR